MAKHMKTFEEFQTFAQSRGYTVILSEEDQLARPDAIAQALGERYAGVYLQFRARGQLYVGQAEDVVRRQKQHERSGVRLRAFAAKAVSDRVERDRTEAREIWQTAIAGYATDNVQLANQRHEGEPLSEDYIDRRLGYMLAAACPDGRGARLEASLAVEQGDELRRLLCRAEFFEAIFVVSLYCSIAVMLPADEWYGRRWGVELLSEGSVTGPWMQVRIRSGEVLRVDLVRGLSERLEPRYFFADIVDEAAEDDPPPATLEEAIGVLASSKWRERLLFGAARREQAHRVATPPFARLLPLSIIR